MASSYSLTNYLLINPTVIERVVTSSGIIVIAYVAHLLLTNSINKITAAISESQDQRINTPRVKTLRGLVKNIIGIAVWSIAFVMILSTWEVNILPILTGAGIVGLAIGFGSQTLVKDVVTGFFILLENQYNVGDFIKIGDAQGKVARMNLRTTILKDEDGTTHIIPNSAIIRVTKYTEEQIEKLKKEGNRTKDTKQKK
jgi:small conductance mechanosensitive channel